MTGSNKTSSAAFPVYNLARVSELIVKTALSHTEILKLSAVACLIIGLPLTLHFKLLHTFGVGLFGYLNLFPKQQIFFTVVFAFCAVTGLFLAIVVPNESTESDSE